MGAPLRIDFVSDVTCPWCAIGLRSLERAIARLGDAVPVVLHLQPFELNPCMRHEGEPIADYAALRDVLLNAAAEVGLDVERARGVLASEVYAAEVRASVRRWQQLGIDSVPSVIVNERQLIQGGQTIEAYEGALRRIADEERRSSTPA